MQVQLEKRCCPYKQVPGHLNLCFHTPMTETSAEPPTVLVTVCEAAFYHCTKPEEK